MYRSVGSEKAADTCHYLCHVTTGATAIKVITKTPKDGGDPAICDIKIN